MHEDLKARTSHLRGFTEGLELGEESKEQKVLHRIIDLLEEMTDEIEQLRVDYEELFEYTEAIDDDLTELEEDFDEDYDDDDDDDEDEFDAFEEGFTIECPNCREIAVVDDDILDEEGSIELTCPGCGEAILVDDEEWYEGPDDLTEPDPEKE